LTVTVLEFAKNPNVNLVEMYEKFIRDFEMRINPLSFTELIILILGRIHTSDEQLAFLEKNEPKIKASKEAQALCKLTKGKIKLDQKKHQETKDILEEVEEMLNAMDGISTVHGRFYLLQSELHKQLKETSAYYRSALKYLGCTPLESLTLEERRGHAENLTTAAIIGENVYNFGELLAHPVLNSLKGTTMKWLVDLLIAFNSGNLKDFRRLKQNWEKIPHFKERAKELEIKIKLLCIMEMTFKRPATERQLAFNEIANEAEVPEDQVEIYVMKAISKGLVKGRIDEVDRKVHMTWVQPRVLDRGQIGSLISRLDGWKKEIQSIESLVEKNASDILM
jgi:26S proteasome regulatory subunit N9